MLNIKYERLLRRANFKVILMQDSSSAFVCLFVCLFHHYNIEHVQVIQNYFMVVVLTLSLND